VRDTGSVYQNLDQLVALVKIQKKLIEVAKEKEEFEKKSVDEMSVEELKKLIG
jgi:hypothetical protein